uniref:Uncharacterized protein n=1 Tax=Vespula pensylvanica TaxID=30213 RepID=A0A834UBW6_VESPE|nr:hypothetical protein H0235_006104 [Vespula pensylvanica]
MPENDFATCLVLPPHQLHYRKGNDHRSLWIVSEIPVNIVSVTERPESRRTNKHGRAAATDGRRVRKEGGGRGIRWNGDGVVVGGGTSGRGVGR